ncbi:MAG: sensor histidine kinase [Sulfurospirillum sp.]
MFAYLKNILKKPHMDSLVFRLIFWFMFLSLTPLVILSFYLYENNTLVIKKNIIKELAKSSELKQKYIENWFNFRFADITSWSQSIYTVDFFKSLSEHFKQNRQEVKVFVKSKQYNQTVRKYESDLMKLLKNYHYVLDIFLINKQGDILYAMAGGKELGTNILKKSFAKTKFSIVYKKTVSDKLVHFSDFEYLKVSDNKETGFLTAPLNDKNGKFIGVIGVQINLNNIFSIFLSQKGYRSYLVGFDGVLRVDISDDKKVLKSKIDLSPFVHKGKGHIPVYKNSFDEEVIGMYKTIVFGDTEWILIDEVKLSMIREDEKKYAVSVLLYLLIISSIVFLVANYIAIQITKPINLLAKASVKVSKGDRNLIANTKRDDEIEVLVRAFNKMIISLIKKEELLAEKSYELYESKKNLQVYNDELEDKISQEIQKNTLQQQMLFNQTRLAQMGEMISMIAHQWRQPLGAIASTSIDLKMKIELESFDLDDKNQRIECQDYFLDGLDNIESFTQDLTTTIDDFRNFYKPNKTLKEICIDEPIQKALKIIEYSLITSNIDLIKNFTSKEKIKIFDGELMQVILNIFKNAQDNFKLKEISQAKIWIQTRDVKNGIVVNICDNGGGIDDKIIEKIFDPYFSTKSQKNGTGLGLYMSKIIVEDNHNGKLSAVNSDKGVCFIIELPSKVSTIS